MTGRGGSEGGEMSLPMASDGTGSPGSRPGSDDVAEAPAGRAPPRRVEASSLRLVSTLTFAGALAGLVIVLVHQWTRPRIEAYQAKVLREAIFEVLGGPDRYETAFLVGGSFTTRPPASADTAALERIYVGYDDGGRPVGVAVAGAEPGFQDVIRLIFGYDPGEGEVMGMMVLESKETPGLGDKIIKDTAFVAEFDGVRAPLEGVKAGAGDGDADEVDMITGATISSRTVIDIINHRLDEIEGPLRDWWGEVALAARPGASR